MNRGSFPTRLPTTLPGNPLTGLGLSCIMKMAELRGQSRHSYVGFVQGALLTWEILAHFAVGSISYFLIFFEKAPFLKSW